MAPELTHLPFDQYQRYAGAARILSAVGGEIRSVLELGANRQKLLGQFLPGRAVTYTDVQPQPGDDNILVADACALPFRDQSYDAVVSLDMLEHVPPDLRKLAVSESARVCARMVVIACPIDRPWVHAAEDAADAIWLRHFKESYPWLAEHKEHGLVDPSEVERLLVGSGLHVVRIPHGDARLWAALMGAHFAKEVVPELAGVVAALDRHYDQEVFASDVSPTSYRELIVGLRDSADRDRIAALTTDPGKPGPGSTLLMAVAEGLLPAIERIRVAELGWQESAEMWRASQAALDAVRAELDATRAERGSVQVSSQETAGRFAEQVRELVQPEALRGAARELRGEVQELRGEVQKLRGEDRELRGEVQALQGEAQELRREVQGLRDALRELRKLMILGIALGGAGIALAVGILVKLV